MLLCFAQDYVEVIDYCRLDSYYAVLAKRESSNTVKLSVVELPLTCQSSFSRLTTSDVLFPHVTGVYRVKPTNECFITAHT